MGNFYSDIYPSCKLNSTLKKINNKNEINLADKNKINKTNFLNDNESKKTLIAITFKTKDGYNLYPPMTCYDTDLFSTIEEKLFFENPELKAYKISFYINDTLIDKSKTLKKNNIKNNSKIILSFSDKETIKINFFSDEPKINYSLLCLDSDMFAKVEKLFYNNFPELKEKNVIYKINNNIIDKSLTLEENNIKNNSIITILISNSMEINISFCSINQRIQCSFYCKDSDIFSNIEKKLYGLYPEELTKEYFFISGGDNIDKSKTLKENNIMDHAVILMVEAEEESIIEKEKLIAVIFKSTDQYVNYIIPCHIDDQFSIIENKLFCEYPALKDRKIFFTINGGIIDKSVSLKENKINNGTVIEIYYFE